MKWDAVILTAYDVEQRHAFEVEIDEIFAELNGFAERFLVVDDRPPNIRIGSGGATLLVLEYLHDRFDNSYERWRVLLIHSGGLSQRLPTASAIGKVFMLLPNGKTFLEMKLLSYRPVLEAMPPGVVICSSDTLEYIPSDIRIGLSEVTLFAHPSTIKVAVEHGVYVMKNDQLWRVLQKPTEQMLRLNDGLIETANRRNEGNALPGVDGGSELMTDQRSGDDSSINNEPGREEYALTDSFFILSPKIVGDLIALKRCTQIECETCCYGDFLRALGTSPLWDYFDVCEPLARARRAYANVFRNRSNEVIRLAKNSFFHFGTVHELLMHYMPSSIFMNHFKITSQQSIYSIIASNSQIGKRSIVELSNFPCGVDIGDDCVISCCSSNRHVIIPSRVIATTITVRHTIEALVDRHLRFVTVAFSVDDNLKARNLGDLRWFSHRIDPCGSMDGSLWNLRIFAALSKAYDKAFTTISTLRHLRRRQSLWGNSSTKIGRLQLILQADVVFYCFLRIR
uniref:L-fucokinase domain-containing protein n=1 Tax=Parascaris univalens TaxID=6257 RepID=A0A915C1J3_PARUN